MKLDLFKAELHTQNIDSVEEIKFELDSGPSAMMMLINFLSDIYKDPETTLMTEYVSNALDSHTVAGKSDIPIEISLPNKLEPYYKVRDFGVGMETEQIENIFRYVFKSTKRSNNDEIGGFGIGKLVFAPYCGVMNLTTFTGDTKTVYLVRLQGGDGGITKLFEGDSDEPRGVEVKVPIKGENFERFETIAQTVYRYLNPKPIIKGVSNFQFTNEGGNGVFYEDDLFIIEDRGAYEHASQVTINNIPFPIDHNILSGDVYNYLKCGGVVLKFNIGELDIVPSRDNLKYTPKTIDAIYQRSQKFNSGYNVKIAKAIIDRCSSYHEAMSLTRLSRLKGGKYNWILYHIFKECSDIEYKGNKIKDDGVIRDFKIYNEDYHYRAITPSNRGLKFGKITSKHLGVLHDYDYYYYYNGVGGGKLTNKDREKINYHIQNLPNTYGIPKYYISSKKKLSYDNFKRDHLLSNEYLIDINSIELPKVGSHVRSEPRAAPYSTSRIMEYQFLNKVDRTNWVDVDPNILDLYNGNGVYVKLKNFKPFTNNDTPINFINLCRVLNGLKGKYPELKIYGFKPSIFKGVIGPGWISVDEFIVNEFPTKSNLNKIKQYIRNTEIIRIIKNSIDEKYITHTKCGVLEIVDNQLRRAKNFINNNSQLIIELDVIRYVEKNEPLFNNRRFNLTNFIKELRSLKWDVIGDIHVLINEFNRRYPLAYIKKSDEVYIEYINALLTYRQINRKRVY